MTRVIELSQALNEKLCHEISNSVGVIDNCMNLMDSGTKTISTHAKKLAKIESSKLVTKVKFFKFVYGILDKTNTISITSLAKMLQDFLIDTKLTLSIKHDKGVLYINSTMAKIILCLIIIANDTVTSAKDLTISIPHKKHVPLFIKFVGRNISIKDNCLDILQKNLKLLLL